VIVPREHWATSTDGVGVHGLEWGNASSDAVALVFVPGGTGNAWSAETIAQGMLDGQLGAERQVLGVSRRGMGLSQAPERGYTPSHFADDAAALIQAADLRRFVVFGHSMGVPIAIEYALRRPERLVGLILGDAPAAYIDFAASGTFDPIFTRTLEFGSWDDAFAEAGLGDRSRFDRIRHRHFIERDGKVVVTIDRAALIRTIEESRTAQTEYWRRLPEIAVPTLLVHASSGWSPLMPGDIDRYKASLPDVQVIALPTAHDLGLNSDPAPLLAALRTFLRQTTARDG
jgi:pimeloyl-ACP methyl ester carboxylesterase